MKGSNFAAFVFPIIPYCDLQVSINKIVNNSTFFIILNVKMHSIQ